MKRLVLVVLILTTAAPAQKKSGKRVVAKPAATAQPTSVAAPEQPRAKLPSQQTVETFMQRMFGQDPNIKWRIVSINPSRIFNVADVVVQIGNPPQISHVYVMPDGEHAIVGDVVPFGADPFLSTRTKLKMRATGPARGPANAKLQIVQFSDLQCPHCKAAHPVFERLMKDYPQAKFVFQHFPLGNHDWAAQAATYAQCVYEQDSESFWTFAKAIFDQQVVITAANASEKLEALAATAGAETGKVGTCIGLPATVQRVQDSIDLGRTVGVTGTPTLYVNGRKIPSMTDIPYESLKQVIDFELKQVQ